jgi:hypothetical protein
MNIDSNLSNEGVGERQLRQSSHRNRKLADAHNANAELRNGNEATGELADGDNCPHGLPSFLYCGSEHGLRFSWRLTPTIYEATRKR